jgi:CheY-like chemotaxis protein
MLEDLGHRVVAAGSGEAALAELRNKEFDLMLTDHAMPRMTGAQLVREIGTSRPGMAVIIASGFAELPDDISAITRLRKPYSQADLVDALRKTNSGVLEPSPDAGSADGLRGATRAFLSKASRLCL